VWDKLVAVKRQIVKTEREMEEVKIEGLLTSRTDRETEGSLWSGVTTGEERDRDRERETVLSIESADRAVAVRALREKMTLRDALQSKVCMKEEEIETMREKIASLSRSLKENTVSVSLSPGMKRERE
jgi:SMC interacting uncharacterized protein involved in chromosome segregation